MKNTFTLAAVCALGLGLSACNSDSSSSSTDSSIDASSYTEWAYFNLATNSVVTESDTWHIAFQRYAVIFNDDIDVALLADQAEFYDDNGDPVESEFVNATADSELEHLTADYDIDNTDFSIPTTLLAIGADGTTFYDYDSTTHNLYANDDAVWVIQSSEGDAYAKFRTVTLYDDSIDNGDGTFGAYDEAEFELFIQGSADSEFSSTATTWSIALTDNAGNECFDIDTAAEVSCDSDDWDINFDFAPSSFLFEITLNGGVSGTGYASAAGSFDVTDTAELVSGIQDNDDDSFDLSTYSYSKDSQESVITESSWYAYGVQGGHSLWPNYRTYGIQTADETYALQITNYYSDAAVSGHISISFQVAE